MLKRVGAKKEIDYKQHTIVDSSGLVIAIETTADKAYSSQKHRDAL